MACPQVGGRPVVRCGWSDWIETHGPLPAGAQSDEGYALAVTAKGITIGAGTDSGYRHGLHTLAQLLIQAGGQLPALTIVDWPAMRMRCAHICYHLAMDWMPESVPNFEALLELIRKLAHWKYNAVLLEIESMFPYRRDPAIAAQDAFSLDQIRRLRALCELLGVEIIPLLQCLGHAYHILRLPQFAHLRETPDTSQQYCPSNPAARTLYLELADEILSAFGPVKRFHIGGDESRRLGICPKCKATATRESIGDLYGRHVGAVAQALLERGVTPLVWSDMIEHHPEACAHLPAAAELVYWKYALPANGTRINFRQFGEHRLWAAAGVRFGACNHTMYRFQEAMQGITFLAGEAHRMDCDQWIVTDWMKGIPFELSALGQAYAADVSWHGTRSLSEFAGAYTLLVFGAEDPRWGTVYADLEPLLPYCEDAQAHQYDSLDRYDLSGLTFRERLAAHTATAVREVVREQLQSGLDRADHARGIVNELGARVTRNQHEWDVVALSVATHAHKSRLGLAMDEAVCLLKFPVPNDAARRQALAARFAVLIEEHDTLRAKTATVLVKGMIESHLRALLDIKFEPAAREWMFYFRKALVSGGSLHSLLGAERAPV